MAKETRFGALLARYCLQAGLSGAALARAAGVDASYVSRLARGEREPPRVEVVDALARGLGLSAVGHDNLRRAAGHGPRDVALADLGDPAVLAVLRRRRELALAGQQLAGFDAALLALCRGWDSAAGGNGS